MKLLTDVELAAYLGVTVDDVHRRCARGWPHVRPKRSVWRFTEAQVEQIVAMQSATTTKVRGPQQTSRSRGRS